MKSRISEHSCQESPPVVVESKHENEQEAYGFELSPKFSAGSQSHRNRDPQGHLLPKRAAFESHNRSIAPQRPLHNVMAHVVFF